MSIFIRNVNTYLSEKKIKQTFLSMRTGIESSKLSRLLTETQDVTAADMEKIAENLGQTVEFFLSKEFTFLHEEEYSGNRIALYAGEVSEKQEQFAEKLIELIENADEVLGAKGRYMMGIGE